MTRSEPGRAAPVPLDHSGGRRAGSASSGVVGRSVVLTRPTPVPPAEVVPVGAEEHGVLVDGMGEPLADVASGVLRTMVSWAQRSLKPARNAMAVKK